MRARGNNHEFVGEVLYGLRAVSGEESRHPADAWIGRVVGEKYRIVRCLGLGGHGAVFEAENTWTGRRVALKVLLGAAALHREISERFLREARAATRVGHPNIIEVLDMGRDVHDGALYIVQELLQGEDLRDLLRRERTMDPHQAIEVLAPICEALSVAHAQGVVHRDLKPANIFLARQHDGRVVPKLIDFGVSRMREDNQDTNELTHTGALLGTPDYMSPEQARGDRSGPQADVWAVGVVLYEALAGQRPYRAANYNALLLKILADDAPPLVSVAPGISPALADIVHRALARDVEQRFATMAALRDALVRWAASHPRLASSADLTPSVQAFPLLDVSDKTPISLEAPPHVASVIAPVSGPRMTDDAPEPASRDGATEQADDTSEALAASRYTPPVRPTDRRPTLPAPSAPSAAPVVPTIEGRVPDAALPATPPKRAASTQQSSLRWVLLSSLAVPLSLVAAWYVVRRAATVRPVLPVLDASTVIPSVATPREEDVVAPRVEPPMARDVPVALDAPVERDVLTRDARATRPRDRPVAVDAPLPELPGPMALRAVFQSMTPAMRGCVGTATGTVFVAVTFLGTGRVERVQVSAPWAGTPSGACIVTVISQLRIAPFRQERFTFSWPYVIAAARQPSQP